MTQGSTRFGLAGLIIVLCGAALFVPFAGTCYHPGPVWPGSFFFLFDVLDIFVSIFWSADTAIHYNQLSKDALDGFPGALFNLADLANVFAALIVWRLVRQRPIPIWYGVVCFLALITSFHPIAYPEDNVMCGFHFGAWLWGAGCAVAIIASWIPTRSLVSPKVSAK